MINYKPIDGIWVRSKSTGIAYKVKAIKLKQNNKIQSVLIYNRPDWGSSRWEWWDLNHFDLLTPINIIYNDNITRCRCIDETTIKVG